MTVPKALEIVSSPILDQDQIFRPEYIRLPKPYERCRLTGLSRSTIAELVVPCDVNGHKPPVKSLVLKKRGATRGIRLVNYDSLLDHLRKLESESASVNEKRPLGGYNVQAGAKHGKKLSPNEFPNHV